MTMESREQVLELWDRVRGGEATEAEAAVLNRWMLENPEARAWMAEAAWLEAELRVQGTAVLGVRPGSASREGRGWNWTHGVAAGLAALLTLGFWSWWQYEPAVATLVRAQSCKWGNSELPTVEGADLPAGMLDLLEGMATLRFESGAEMILEAPVTVQLLSKMECRVEEGTVVAEVPESAIGFTVYTPETTVVDYGTRFGVSADPDGKCLVHVMEGEVEVNRSGEAEARRLTRGQRVDYGGMVASQLNPEIQEQEERVRHSPQMPAWQGDGWQTVTTAFGRGRDSWIQSSRKVKVRGDEAYLRVKYTSLSADLQRKTYLGFDLSDLRHELAQAELVLQLAASDLGYASLVPDARFTVFGLIDESQEDWSESDLTWNRAPAHREGEEFWRRPVAEEVVELGSFHIPQGKQRGEVSLGGDALLAFMREDRNGLVTFILCRETDETGRSGLVHAFASKEHPFLPAPALRLKWAD